jgi:hypothetical protein
LLFIFLSEKQCLKIFLILNTIEYVPLDIFLVDTIIRTTCTVYE